MNTADLIRIARPIRQMGKAEGSLGKLRLNSRDIKKEDVFIAVRGSVTDGHRYIPDAVKRGAKIVIAEQLPEKCSPDGTPLFLQVADTRKVTGELAQAFSGYPARSMKMVGVTGTNGKTTVCTLVYQVLRKLGYNAGLIGTVETRYGDTVLDSSLTTPDPVSLASILEDMAQLDTAYAIMEVSSHALDQHRVGGIRFDIAAFTNISQDHLDYHKDMASYIKAKRKLFASLDAEATAVVNRDDPSSRLIVKGCKAEVWGFGFLDSTGDFRILDERPEGMVLDLDETIVSTPLTGSYNARNVAQAYLVCIALGCSKKSVAAALGQVTGAPGRLERVLPAASPIPCPTVFVDYAHTPDALENVLKAFVTFREKGETLHAVFGCGGNRDVTKRPEMGRIADLNADVITLTSDNPRSEDPVEIIRDIRRGITRKDRIFLEENRRKAIRSAILEADTRTIVLVAGKGHEKYQEINGRKVTFDDREIARKALTEWIERRISKKSRRSQNQKREVC